ncbi:MAG: hypothetical protein JW741_25245 [Sedimentisphaerales bacterium]|nr:hypothetical protein [Sedimentisphaerales bacterium]
MPCKAISLVKPCRTRRPGLVKIDTTMAWKGPVGGADGACAGDEGTTRADGVTPAPTKAGTCRDGRERSA